MHGLGTPAREELPLDLACLWALLTPLAISLAGFLLCKTGEQSTVGLL